MWGKGFYLRLMLGCLLIVLVYTMTATGLFYYKNNEIGQIQLDNQQRQFVEQVRDQIDTRLNVGMNLINQLKNNDYIVRYAESQEADYYLITRSYRELRGYLDGFFNFGLQIEIVKPDSPVVLTPYYTISPDRYFRQLGLNTPSADLVRDFADNAGLVPFILGGASGLDGALREEGRITLVRKIAMASRSELYFMLALDERSLLPYISPDLGEGFAILNKDGWVTLRTGNNMEEVEKLLHEDNLRDMMAKAGEYGKVDRQDGVVHVIRSGQMPDWHYVYFAPRNNIGQQFRETLLQSLAVCAALLLLGVAIALLVANRTYKPVGSALKVFKGFVAGEESDQAKDELAYMQQTAAKIDQNNRRLSQQLKDLELPFRQKKLKDLLFGLVEPDCDPWLEHSDSWSVALIEYGNYGELEKKLSQEALFQLKRQVTDEFKQECEDRRCELFELTYKRMVILLPEYDRHNDAAFLNRLIVEAEEKWQIELTTAIGAPVASACDLRESYREALELLENRFALDKRTVIAYNDLSRKSQIGHYMFPLDLERELINLTVTGKREEAEAVLDRILHENLQVKGLRGEALTPLVYNLVSALNRIHQATDDDATEAVYGPQAQLHAILKESANVEQLQDTIKSAFADIHERIAEQHSQKDHSVADQMLKYIHDHYGQDLSLSDLSAHFKLSHGYISQLFKTYIRENFKDYLNKHRVQVAKQLLAEQRLKVGEIAEKVGCNNVNTFIRMFKRYEGVSPGQYAKEQGDNVENAYKEQK